MNLSMNFPLILCGRLLIRLIPAHPIPFPLRVNNVNAPQTSTWNTIPHTPAASTNTKILPIRTESAASNMYMQAPSFHRKREKVRPNKELPESPSQNRITQEVLWLVVWVCVASIKIQIPLAHRWDVGSGSTVSSRGLLCAAVSKKRSVACGCGWQDGGGRVIG